MLDLPSIGTQAGANAKLNLFGLRASLPVISLSEGTGLRERAECPIDGAEILIDHAGL